MIDRAAELAEMQRIRKNWGLGINKKSPETIFKEWHRFKELVERYPHRAKEDLRTLDDWWEGYKLRLDSILEHAKADCRIGWFKPSWEQAQILNTWHPEEGGFRSVCVFAANRIGKTTACVIDTLLWLIPNDPEWVIFEPFTDHLGREVHVRRRPNWDYWQRTGKLEYPTDEPPKGECQIWQGVPTDDHWKDKIGKEYRHWIPPSAIGYRGKDLMWNIAEKWFQTKWGSEVRAKTYLSDVMAWAGKAVWRINLDEGIPKHLYGEAITRIQAGGYFHWSYTPAEARNLGDRAKLAHDVYKGNPEVKPPGKVKCFINFRMADAPDYILPEEKKKDDIARFSAMGGEGKVRMEGGFQTSSPVVFNNFKRESHILPWDGPTFLKKFPESERLLIRGMDEGTAAPSACVWLAVLKTGEYVAYRDWEEANLSITERCEKIIHLSRNTRELVTNAHDPRYKRFKEIMGGEKIKRTFADYKMFKRDPEDLKDDWTERYRRQGLDLHESAHIGPAQRCDFTNDLFLPDHTRKHLARVAGEPPEITHRYPEHGFKLYVTSDCVKIIERMENYLHDQVKSGPRMGEFTGKPSTHDDHVVDCLTYCCTSNTKWRPDHFQMPFTPQRASTVTGYAALR